MVVGQETSNKPIRLSKYHRTPWARSGEPSKSTAPSGAAAPKSSPLRRLIQQSRDGDVARTAADDVERDSILPAFIGGKDETSRDLQFTKESEGEIRCVPYLIAPALRKPGTKSPNRRVSFSDLPPEVYTIEVSPAEWRGKRIAIRQIAQNVGQNLQDWATEKAQELCAANEQAAQPVAAVTYSYGDEKGGDTPKNVKLEVSGERRWSDLEGDMDFSRPPGLPQFSSPPIEVCAAVLDLESDMDFSKPPGLALFNSASTEVTAAAPMKKILPHIAPPQKRWADLDGEMDWSAPLAFKAAR